jgi:hypothetical protein
MIFTTNSHEWRIFRQASLSYSYLSRNSSANNNNNNVIIYRLHYV